MANFLKYFKENNIKSHHFFMAFVFDCKRTLLYSFSTKYYTEFCQLICSLGLDIDSNIDSSDITSHDGIFTINFVLDYVEKCFNE